MDDWGSGLACGVEVALGTLLHEILPEVIERALPTWDAMAVVNAAAHDHDEHAQVERLKIQQKGLEVSVRRVGLLEADQDTLARIPRPADSTVHASIGFFGRAAIAFWIACCGRRIHWVFAVVRSARWSMRAVQMERRWKRFSITRFNALSTLSV